MGFTLFEAALLGSLSQPVEAASVYSLSSHPIANATDTHLETSGLTFDTTGGIADTTNSLLVASSTGIWAVQANVVWNSSAAGVKYLSIWRNGDTTDRLAHTDGSFTGAQPLNCAAIVRLCRGDNIGMFIFQQTGASLSTDIVFPSLNNLAMVKLGPA